VWTGDEAAIHRFSTVTAFTFELHRSYLADIKDAQNPAIYTFWKRRMEQHRNPQVPFVNVDTFQSAMWSLLKGLELDFGKEFSCETCGNFETAPVLIIDAKALVCQPGSLHEDTTDAKNAGFYCVLVGAWCRSFAMLPHVWYSLWCGRFLVFIVQARRALAPNIAIEFWSQTSRHESWFYVIAVASAKQPVLDIPSHSLKNQSW